MLSLALLALAYSSSASFSFAQEKTSPPPLSGKVYVVNTASGSVSLVDLSAKREIASYPVGNYPYGIALNAKGTVAVVGIEGEAALRFYQLPEFKKIAEFPMGYLHHSHIILTNDGKYFLASNYKEDYLVGIDTTTFKEAFRIPGLSGPHAIKYGPLNKNVYVTEKKVIGIGSVDVTQKKIVRELPLTVNPRSMTFSLDESKLYFASYWVNAVFEMEIASGAIKRMFEAAPPKDNAGNQEVTYHGVQLVGEALLLAANEGRGYVDSFDIATGQFKSRISAGKPCCIEPLPKCSTKDLQRVLLSNPSSGTVEVLDVRPDGVMQSAAIIPVGKGPKRVVLVP